MVLCLDAALFMYRLFAFTPHHRTGPRLAGLLLALASLCASAEPASPVATLQGLSEQMFTVLKAEREGIYRHPERLFELVDQVLGPHVDFPRMSRWVLGKHWRRASPEQRQRFIAQFRLLLVRFYVSALLQDPTELDQLLAHTDTLIQFQPSPEEAAGDDIRVRAQVKLSEGAVVPVSFSLHRSGREWKVYDVNVDGISLVVNYRSSFGTEVSRNGLDALIDRLAAHNHELLQQTAAGVGGQ